MNNGDLHSGWAFLNYLRYGLTGIVGAGRSYCGQVITDFPTDNQGAPGMKLLHLDTLNFFVFEIIFVLWCCAVTFLHLWASAYLWLQWCNDWQVDFLLVILVKFIIGASWVWPIKRFSACLHYALVLNLGGCVGFDSKSRGSLRPPWSKK
jgi:hypothetical protein